MQVDKVIAWDNKITNAEVWQAKEKKKKKLNTYDNRYKNKMKM